MQCSAASSSGYGAQSARYWLQVFSLIYLYGGFAHPAIHVHIMLTSGLAMAAIYGYVFFACYKPFSIHVAAQRWKEAGEILGRIRKLIALNLVLGLLTVCVVAIGVAWG